MVVNDEYCDCLDGSDEPATSACSQLSSLVFMCKSSAAINASVPLSRVNDGSVIFVLSVMLYSFD